MILQKMIIHQKKVPELLVLTTAGDNLDGTELHYGAVVNGNGVRRINSSTFKGKEELHLIL